MISDSFELYASSAERTWMVQDFYGKEVALFANRNENPKTLQEILQEADDTRRKRVLESVKQNLTTMYV